MKYFFLFVAFFSFMSLIKADTGKVFVGYIKNKPVFDSYTDNKLYSYNDKFNLIRNYPKNYSVRLVKDEYTIFSYKNSIIIEYKGLMTSYLIDSSYISIDENGVAYVTDSKDQIKILKNGKILDSGINGYVITVNSSYLYFTKVHDKKVVHANADLFKASTQNLKKTIKVVSDISGEATVVLSGGKYIFDSVLYKGQFRPAIFSVESGKFNFLNIDTKYDNSIPFFQEETNSVIFYDEEKFSTYKVKIPVDFSVNR